MKWFLNLKVKAKLILGFSIVAVIAAIIGIVAIINIKALDDSDTILYKRNTEPLGYMVDVATSFQRIRVNVRQITISNDPNEIERKDPKDPGIPYDWQIKQK